MRDNRGCVTVESWRRWNDGKVVKRRLVDDGHGCRLLGETGGRVYQLADGSMKDTTEEQPLIEESVEFAGLQEYLGKSEQALETMYERQIVDDSRKNRVFERKGGKELNTVSSKSDKKLREQWFRQQKDMPRTSSEAHALSKLLGAGTLADLFDGDDDLGEDNHWMDDQDKFTQLPSANIVESEEMKREFNANYWDERHGNYPDEL